MKKILLKACLNPLDNKDAFDVLKDNLIADNSGNLLYSYGIMRTIMSDMTQVDTVKNIRFSDEQIDRINQEYDCFVIPLANAFRENYIQELKNLTKSIKKIKIPCIVAGVGIQESFDPDLNAEHVFDEAARDFVSAVLEKSESIGVRGEITGEYLRRLGFTDYTVIGCPSMYMRGDNLLLKESRPLTTDSTISITASSGMPDTFLQMIENTRRRFPNHFFVPQEIKEFKLMYAGVGFPQRFPGHDIYPNKISREIYHNGKARMFYNVPAWLEYMKGIDFSFGSRIHGNLIAVLAGVPSVVFSFDSRTRELAEYHNIPFVPMDCINENTDIIELYENADFSKVLQGHEKRFGQFLQFLDCNRIPHLNREELNTVTPFDLSVREIKWNGPLHSINTVDSFELEKRLDNYYHFQMDKTLNLKKKVRDYKNKLDQLSKENEAMKKEISTPLFQRMRRKFKK